MRLLLPLVTLAALLAAAPPAGAEEKERSATEVWAETLRFGTDTEVLDAVTHIREAKERSLTADLVRAAGESHNDDVRMAVFTYLGELEDASASEPALELVRRPEEASPALLRAAIGYLAKTKARSALDELKGLVLSRDESVAIAAVSAVGGMGGAGIAAYLIDILVKPETNANLRNQIILALGDLGDRVALDLLLDMAKDRGEERVSRMYACASLGKIGDRKAVDVLTSILSEDDALLRVYAAGALGKLRAPGVAAALTQVLRDSSWQVRLEAAKAIADGAADKQESEDLVGMLKYRARRDEVAQVRREAIRALGTLGTPDCFELLRELYADDMQSAETRSAALTALIAGDLPESLPVISRIVDQQWSLKSDKQKMLEVTADQLSRVESPLLSELTSRFLASPNLAVKIAGIRGAARNGLTSLGDAILAAARDANTAVRREALSALEKLGIPAPSPTTGSGS
jgi:HEAT repeat protein